MVINSFTVIMSILLFTIVSAICSLFLFRSKSQHLWIIAFCLILCVLRCLIPVEIDGTYNVNVWSIYLDFFALLEKELFRGICVSELICIIWLTVSFLLLIGQIKDFLRQLKFNRALRLYPKNTRIDHITKEVTSGINLRFKCSYVSSGGIQQSIFSAGV